MDLTRRGFVSRLGMLCGGVAMPGRWLKPSAWTVAPSALVTPRHLHTKDSLDTHASESAADKLAAAEEIWANLMAGNARFVAGKPMVRDIVDRRSELIATQKPKVAVLGCADSRVSPSLIFDQGLGDLFEVRTAGNVADAIVIGSVEYAVEHIPVHVLVILGHEKCGGVAAAASGEKMPSPNLQALVDKISPVLAKVKGDHKSQEFLRKAEEVNVRQCAADLVANSPIIAHEAAANNLQIVKAVYSLATGQVRRLVE